MIQSSPKAEVRGSNPFGRAICVQNRERVRFLAGYRVILYGAIEASWSGLG